MTTTTQELQNLQEIHDLIMPLERRQPSRKSDLIDFFRTNKECKIIDSHNTSSIIVVLSGAEVRYVLKIECGQDSATARELHWYNHYSLPDIESSFISGGVFDHFSYIIMRHIDNIESLADTIFNNSVRLNSITRWVDTAFNSDLRLFDSTKRRRLPHMQYLDAYVKYKTRTKEALKFPFLKELIDCESISINGRVYLSPSKILNYIYSHQRLVEKIFTHQVGIIHGDLHIGNMVHSSSFQGNLTILDPGSVCLLPIQYDGGKVLQSIHSGYEQIMRGLYTLKATGDNSYNLIVDSIRNLDSAYAHICQTWDEGLLTGSLFMEAMHFLTMVPHHASNQNESIALYLTGARLLNRLIDSLELN